jgi:hypothetical protein
MKNNVKSIGELVKALPPEAQEEVRSLVTVLSRKKIKKMPGKMEFRWAGALKDLRDKYTSVELQHKILEWRIGEK